MRGCWEWGGAGSLLAGEGNIQDFEGPCESQKLHTPFCGLAILTIITNT